MGQHNETLLPEKELDTRETRERNEKKDVRKEESKERGLVIVRVIGVK